jgi:transcriptional regulator with XRE-family HTH domain
MKKRGLVVDAEHLMAAMRQAEISNSALAEQLGVSRSQVHDWTHGNAAPLSSHLYAMSDVLGVSVEYLLGREKLADQLEAAIDRVRLHGGEPIAKVLEVLVRLEHHDQEVLAALVEGRAAGMAARSPNVPVLSSKDGKDVLAPRPLAPFVKTAAGISSHREMSSKEQDESSGRNGEADEEEDEPPSGSPSPTSPKS